MDAMGAFKVDRPVLLSVWQMSSFFLLLEAGNTKDKTPPSQNE